jgi:hypothetical protein
VLDRFLGVPYTLAKTPSGYILSHLSTEIVLSSMNGLKRPFELFDITLGD